MPHAPAVTAPTTPAARRTQAERRAESERGLLMAAARLIATEGVAAATLERVGAMAGYSRGLATQRFGSKPALIEALITHLHGRLEALLSEAQVESMTGRDAVLAFADLFLRGFALDEEVRAYFMLMASAVADITPSRAAFAASHQMVSQRLQAMIRRGHQDGSITPEVSAPEVATLLGSTLLGLTTQHLIDAATDLAGLRTAMLAGLRAGLAAVQ